MATRQDLVRRALAVLNADGGAGQEPSAEDYDRMDSAVEACLADLARRGVTYVPDLSGIEPEQLEWVAIVLAQFRAADFGSAMSVDAINMAERRLRSIGASPTAQNMAYPEYF